MLILSRKTSESIVIELEDGRTITVTAVAASRDKVRLGLEAPPTIKLHREEVRARNLADRHETPAA